jgi:hypothetical protein
MLQSPAKFAAVECAGFFAEKRRFGAVNTVPEELGAIWKDDYVSSLKSYETMDETAQDLTPGLKGHVETFKDLSNGILVEGGKLTARFAVSRDAAGAISSADMTENVWAGGDDIKYSRTEIRGAQTKIFRVHQQGENQVMTAMFIDQDDPSQSFSCGEYRRVGQ